MRDKYTASQNVSIDYLVSTTYTVLFNSKLRNECRNMYLPKQDIKQ